MAQEGSLIAADLFYAFPQAAYLILGVIFIAALYIFLDLHRRRALVNFASNTILPLILHRRPRFLFFQKVLLICSVWVFGAYALMDPQGNAHYPEEERTFKKEEEKLPHKRIAHEVVLIIDTSASMNVKDMRSEQSRFDYAKEIGDEIIKHLKGETVSIYAFTSQTEKIVPSTLDYFFARLMLKNLAINEGGVGGTDIHQALKTVMEDYPAQSNRKLKTFIILSDGEDIRYEDLPEQERKQMKQAFIDTIGNPTERNLQLFTIGMGTKKGGAVPGVKYQGKEVHTALQDALLAALSKQGKGLYFEANNNTPHSIAMNIINEINSRNSYLQRHESDASSAIDKSKKDLIYDRYYQIPLGIAAILLAIFLLVPDNWHREEK